MESVKQDSGDVKAPEDSEDFDDLPEDENPREKGDDDGVEYGDPRDELRERSRQ